MSEYAPTIGVFGARLPALVAAESAFSERPQSAGEVRLFVRSTCVGWNIGRQATETAVLISSELAANAIQHAHTPFVVGLSRTEGSLNIGVLDGSDELPRRLPPSTERVGGRGVYLLDQLASTWGFERHPLGKAIWFSIKLIPEPADPVVKPADV